MNEDNDLLFQEWEDDSLLLLENFDDVPSSFQSGVNNQIMNQASVKGETFLQKMDEDLDYAFALALQTQFEDEVQENTFSNSKKSCTKESQSSKPLSIIDEQWELIDPHPDIHALFEQYDSRFFYGKLKHVEVKWSQRMTLCAGVCSYEGRGGLCSIRLSVPLLKLRPRKDLVETLLHEMIHAYLFVTHNNRDRDGHGPEFLRHMHRINKESGTRITVYHSFHDEVDLYRQHWWKCNGPCKKRHPYYGVLKRAMNRPPGPKDNWWADHQANCGGTFIKIKEPENYGKKKSVKRKVPSDCKGSSSNIKSFFGNDKLKKDTIQSIPSTAKSDKSYLDSSLIKGNNVVMLNSKIMSPKKLIPFQGIGHKLGGSSDTVNIKSPYIKENNFSRIITSSSSPKKVSSVEFQSNLCKVPRLSSSNRSVYEDQKHSKSVTTNSTKRNLVQSPIEKFLSSKIVKNSNKSENSCIKLEDNCINYSNMQENEALKVSCPVCFILVKQQDINSHLDLCLSS